MALALVVFGAIECPPEEEISTWKRRSSELAFVSHFRQKVKSFTEIPHNVLDDPQSVLGNIHKNLN